MVGQGGIDSVQPKKKSTNCAGPWEVLVYFENWTFKGYA